MMNRITFGAVLIPTSNKRNEALINELQRPYWPSYPSVVQFLNHAAQAQEPRNTRSRSFNPDRGGELIIDLKTSDELMKANLDKAGFQEVQIIPDSQLRLENQELYDRKISNDIFITEPLPPS